jgi:hypothetical protein
MSIFVLVFVGILLGLMDWSQSVIGSWIAVAGISTAFLAASLLARNKFRIKKFLMATGLLGFLTLGAAFLIKFLTDWMSSSVQPLV